MYVIIQTRYFYGRNQHHTLMEDDISGITLRFATTKEAKAYIEELEENVYDCADREYRRPTYRVCRIDRLPEHLAEMVF